MPSRRTTNSPSDLQYQRRLDVRFEEVAGESIILDERQEKVHQLNRSASFIWKLCDGRTSVKEIVRQLVEQFDVDEEVACRDVSEALAELRNVGLID